jgi:hypothetical protein
VAPSIELPHAKGYGVLCASPGCDIDARNAGDARLVAGKSDLLSASAESAMTAAGNQSPIGEGKGAAAPVRSRLHPRVYMLLVALTLWFALAVWSFAGGGMTDYLLVIVSGFIFVAVALPLILSRVGGADRAITNDAAQGGEPSLRDWAVSDFDTWTGRLSGTQAALQILLPIAAAAVGMTVIGIVFHIAERGGV